MVLSDTGWPVPASATAYWVGEAMGGVDFQDLTNIPDKVAETAAMATANGAHLAGMLKARPYPGVGR